MTQSSSPPEKRKEIHVWLVVGKPYGLEAHTSREGGDVIFTSSTLAPKTGARPARYREYIFLLVIARA